MWRRLRAEGWPIVATWIDEDGEGATADFGELWDRIRHEVTGAAGLILYAEPGDLPLKGALIEVGMALAAGVPVVAVLPGVVLEPRSMRPIGSWLAHPLVSMAPSVEVACSMLWARVHASEAQAELRERDILAGRLQGRIDAAVERAGSMQEAITGPGFGIGILLARDIVRVLRGAGPDSAPAWPDPERVEMEDWSDPLHPVPAEPIWRLAINGFCADFPSEVAARNFLREVRALAAANRPGCQVRDEGSPT